MQNLTGQVKLLNKNFLNYNVWIDCQNDTTTYE